MKVGAGIMGVSTAASVIGGTIKGISSGDWSRLANAGKALAGMFYLDSNRDFLGQLWQGISRHTWESPQTLLGYNYTQLRNAFGGVDRIDYFGGATFATNEFKEGNPGVSLGNYININIEDSIEGSFRERVLNDPLYMHEYGHTFDSKIFGLSYLVGVGLPSLFGGGERAPNEPRGVLMHDFKRVEMRANKHAAKYFKQFGINWNDFEVFYPRRRR